MKAFQGASFGIVSKMPTVDPGLSTTSAATFSLSPLLFFGGVPTQHSIYLKKREIASVCETNVQWGFPKSSHLAVRHLPWLKVPLMFLWL